MPFTIICHAKRLLKTNLNEIAAYIFDKFNESKSFFLKFVQKQQKRDNDKFANYSGVIRVDTSDMSVQNAVAKNDMNQRPNSASSRYHSEFGSLEQLISNIIRVFSFFR